MTPPGYAGGGSTKDHPSGTLRVRTSPGTSTPVLVCHISGHKGRQVAVVRPSAGVEDRQLG